MGEQAGKIEGNNSVSYDYSATGTGSTPISDAEKADEALRKWAKFDKDNDAI